MGERELWRERGMPVRRLNIFIPLKRFLYFLFNSALEHAMNDYFFILFILYINEMYLTTRVHIY